MASTSIISLTLAVPLALSLSLPLSLLALALASVACPEPGTRGLNRSPTAQIISHRDRDPVREGVSVDVVGTVGDIDLADDTLALTVRWSVGGVVACGPMPPEPTGITSCAFVPDTPGDLRVILEVEDRAGALGRAAVWLNVVATAPPVAVIQRPLDGQVFAPAEPVDFVGNVQDPEDEAPLLTVGWSSDLAGDLPALAGPNAAGEVTGRATLGPGAHHLIFRVTDTTGKQASDAVDITVLAPNVAPTCSITAPLEGSSGPGAAGVRLVATLADADDGVETMQVRFESDLDGLLGRPTPTTAGDVSLMVTALSGGVHALKLTVTDPDGALCTDQVLYTATVPPSPPTVQILAPVAATYLAGTPLDLEVQVGDDRDAPAALAIAWTSDRDGALGTPTADATGFARLPAVPLSLGAHRLTVTVIDTDGGVATDGVDIALATVVDNPPSAPVIHFEPVPTRERDSLRAVIDTPGVDPEGQVVTHRFAWSLDGQPSAETGATIAAALTVVGQRWAVSVVASDGVYESPPATAQTTIVADLPPPAGCALPAVYTRVNHLQGAIDFQRVAFAPDGSYALILGSPKGLFRYDPAAAAGSEITLVDAGLAGERLRALTFDLGGAFALVGGDDGAMNPVLYRFDDGLGLTPVTGIVGIASGALVATSRIIDIAQQPGTDTFTFLVDNGASANPQLTFLHQVLFDWAGGAHAFTYYGGLNTSQGASSLAWGQLFGQPIAIAVSRYLEIMRFEPALSSNNFTLESRAGTGNLKRVIFDPVGHQIAWLLQRSGSGKVYAWEGQLHSGATDAFGFSSWSMYDFAVREDGTWKIFVGRNGNIWFSDSPFRPVDPARFTNAPLLNFTQSPWYGTTNDYLQGAAFRPGTCEGLIVGDATGGSGLLVHFALTPL